MSINSGPCIRGFLFCYLTSFCIFGKIYVTLNWFSSFFHSFKRGFDGFLPFNMWAPSPRFNDFGKDSEKIRIAFSNPALLKVLAIQCNLFSLARVYVYQNDVEVKDDPILAKFNDPNPLQSAAQFKWDMMFYKLLGTANIYVDSGNLDRASGKNFMYALSPTKIDWPPIMDKLKDKMVFSDAGLRDLQKTKIKYNYEDGTKFEFELGQMVIVTDLTNGVGNFFKGFSKIDALTKIISNTEVELNSKNINAQFSARFLVAGKNDPDDILKAPMSRPEKDDIEKKFLGEDARTVTAVRSMAEIKRFIERVDVLKALDEAYLNDYFKIGNMYDIPRDVLEAFQSSTYENQEKAKAGLVEYVLSPAGEEFGDGFARMFSSGGKSYREQGKKIIFSWEHLSFSQVFEKERASVAQTKVQSFVSLRKNGVSLESANKFLDTDFKEDPKDENTENQSEPSQTG